MKFILSQVGSSIFYPVSMYNLGVGLACFYSGLPGSYAISLLHGSSCVVNLFARLFFTKEKVSIVKELGPGKSALYSHYEIKNRRLIKFGSVFASFISVITFIWALTSIWNFPSFLMAMPLIVSLTVLVQFVFKCCPPMMTFKDSMQSNFYMLLLFMMYVCVTHIISLGAVI